jgi:hypothetical protein
MSWPRHGFPTQSQELLLRAALLDGERAVAAWERWQAVEDVSQTDGDSLRMMPLVCRNLLAITTDVPQLATLKSIYRHQWVANHQRLHRAGLGLRILERAGIQTMVLKGAALAHAYYRDVGVRVFLDVDVLVRAERAQEAGTALRAAAWSQSLPTDLETLLPVTQGTMFTDAVDGAIDLHWHALWSPAVEDDFWDAAEPVEIGGSPTLMQCAPDQLLHACVHGIWSDGYRIRWVADAVTVLRAAPDLDWDRVISRARARAITPPLHEALTYIRNVFDAPVPGPVLRSLETAPRRAAEWRTHRAWMAPASRLRTARLVLEHFRRQRALPVGPTRRGNLRKYLRCWAAMAWDVDRGDPIVSEVVRRLLPRGSRFAPERP